MIPNNGIAWAQRFSLDSASPHSFRNTGVLARDKIYLGCAPNCSPSSPAKDDLQGENENADDDQQQKAKRTKFASTFEAWRCRNKTSGRESGGRNDGINLLNHLLTNCVTNLISSL